ncbi:MAG: hypothetical protein ACRCT8_02245 [Lacipirellulaceae bacterium]
MLADRLRMLALLAALSLGSTGCGLLGYGRCGGGCGDMSCAMGGGCGADLGCAVEPGCGVEPSCGCGGGGCGIGRSYAGQRWIGDCACRGPEWNFCTDGCHGGCAGGCHDGGGGACAEPACDCGDAGCGDVACGGDVSCGMQPGCGCEPTCGASPCSCGRCPMGRLGDGVLGGLDCIASEVRAVFRPLFGCGGCDSELYWNEWHNDPPRCNDPCDPCGNWVGPAGGHAHAAPFEHDYMPNEMASRGAKVATKPGQLKKLH